MFVFFAFFLVDGDEEEEEGYDYVPIGDQKIGIKTSALEEKATGLILILILSFVLFFLIFIFSDQKNSLSNDFQICCWAQGRILSIRWRGTKKLKF